MDLYTMMSREFSAAKLTWGLIVTLQITLLVCSIVAASANGTSLLLLGGAILIIPIASMLLKWRAETYRDRGERLRRAYVLQNALGKIPEAAVSLATAAKATHLPKIDPDPIGQYFTSVLPQGIQRLAENVGESAFYTWRISTLTGYFCAVLTAGGMFIAILTLWWAIQVGIPAGGLQPGVHEAALRAAKLFADLFSFLAAGVFAELWWLYRSLARESECVFLESLKMAQEKTLDSAKVFATLSDYDTALAKAPPLPGTLKRLCGTGLAKLWDDHLKSKANP